MELICTYALAVAVWFGLLAVIFAGYAGCAFLSGVPLKTAFRSCWVVMGVWGLLPVVPAFIAWLASDFRSEVSLGMFLVCAPGGTALVLLCRLRRHATMDLPTSVEVLLVLLASALGLAIACWLFRPVELPHFPGP